MPLNLVLYLIFSLLDLLKGTIVWSIPTFFLVLIITFVRRKVAEKYKLNWVKSAIASTFIVLFTLILILYFSPIVLSLGQETIGEIPAEGRPALLEILGSLILFVLRLFLVAVVISLILLPFEFVAVYLFEKVSRTWRLNYYINLYIVSFLVTLIAAIILLFIFPWSLAGMLYLLFFGT